MYSESQSSAGWGTGSLVIGGAILLILLFGIFGGAWGRGFDRGGYEVVTTAAPATTVTAVESINQTAYWRDAFNAFAALGNQANVNAAAIKDQVTQQTFLLNGQINALGNKIDQNRYDDLLLAYNQQGQKLTAMETIGATRMMLEPVYAQIAALGCEVSKLPRTLPLYASGVTACGQAVPSFINERCGC